MWMRTYASRFLMLFMQWELLLPCVESWPICLWLKKIVYPVLVLISVAQWTDTSTKWECGCMEFKEIELHNEDCYSDNDDDETSETFSLNFLLLMTRFDYYSYINFQVFHVFAKWLQFLPILRPLDLLLQVILN